MTGRLVLDLADVDRSQVALVGGKAAHLGELSRLEGVRVPPGFCVTTDAFRRAVATVPRIDDQLDRLARLHPDDRAATSALAAAIRRALEAVEIGDDLAAEITGSLARLGAGAAWAVRSSATAEDSPVASSAGQQDTYLNVVGPAAVLRHVSRCWASLFTERAVAYRRRHGLDHRRVHMAVVVQQMVFPQAAGVVFTADPLTQHRKVASVEATVGLGEALAAGLVNPDVYTVRDGGIVAKAVAAKRLAVHPSPGGGTAQVAIGPERQRQPALTDAQVVRVVQLGRRIEAHFGRPQDVEWCLAHDEIHVVQSRPITTLFPVPVATDGGLHVYVSVGHQQMMTDPMKPLGISMWQLTAARPMTEAGGRLFVDVTEELASPTRRAGLLEALGRSDPLIGDALRTVLARGYVVPTSPLGDAGGEVGGDAGGGAPVREASAREAPAREAPPALIEADPALVGDLMARARASLAALQREIRTRTGTALLDVVLADVQELRRILFDPQSLQVIGAGMGAARWLEEHLEVWLDEGDAVGTLTRSVPGNVTSAMGLALLDVADAVRPHPEVVAFLERAGDDDFLGDLGTVAGGREARDAIEAFLATYGMRCAGEIDITRPRWSERPTALVPQILANVKGFEQGAGERRFERGRREAWAKEQELLARLRALPGGEHEAGEAKAMIDRVRTFAGYREYPKYHMVSRYLVYKQALLREAERLVRRHVLREREDVFFLRFQELHDVVRTNVVDHELLRRRKEELRSYRALTPPRVLTSDGEVVPGEYRRAGVPAGTLVGLPVSAGTVEGRARVVLDMTEAELGPGDILVTTSTDPGWTPAFVAIDGLVTEVGGLMTHGAVIAREYGLPAVVGVQQATRLIRDGQRIRVNGTDGTVAVLS